MVNKGTKTAIVFTMLCELDLTLEKRQSSFFSRSFKVFPSSGWLTRYFFKKTANYCIYPST